MKNFRTTTLLFFSLLCITVSVKAQSALNLNFQPYSWPYTNTAAELYGTYINSLQSPSMSQSLATTTSLYNLAYYGMSKIKYDNIDNPYLQALAQIGVFYASEIALTYLPGGSAWLHEEYHRSVLTNNHTASYDQIYSFPILASVVSVDHVNDQDLINFKANNPQDFVRLHAAGIEGEYLLVRNLQKLNFFDKQKYGYFISELDMVINNIAYVWFSHTQAAEEETIKFNQEETSIEQRDFTGFDFTAWVYDLYRPYEPYSARGIHPTGTGIDRYIKPSDLTVQELNYLKIQGYLQLTNLINPMLFGINELKIKGKQYNFALSHYLTSFGYDLSFSLFSNNKHKTIYTAHLYRNRKLYLPGIEAELYRKTFTFGNMQGQISGRINLWLQPENLIFYDTKYTPGSSVNFELAINKVFKQWKPYFSISAKTKGWEAGSLYQTQGIFFNTGIKFQQSIVTIIL